jgi:Polyketide cyclase / dehydrase and lipid transport
MTETRRLTGRLHVGLPPSEAFRLFTPRGEQDWAHGWQPHFPAPAPDDTEPGTVFETAAHGQHTIWTVTERERGCRMSYARVTPGHQAGTVTVRLTAAGDGSEVEVTYQLTALSDAAGPHLAGFADGYDAYLRSWEEDIAALLATRG